MVSFFDFLRHEKQAGKGHDDSADAHADPPERADVLGIPNENAGYRTAGGYVEFEFKEYRGDGEEVDANERINKTRTAQALAQFFNLHRSEAIG